MKKPADLIQLVFSFYMGNYTEEDLSRFWEAMSVFFHGIDLKFLKKQYPFLYPEANISSKNPTQLEDRKHLVERFGLEPVHLLESSPSYPVKKCVMECLSFGEVVFAFRALTDVFFQLSQHEIGVPFLDVRRCSHIFVKSDHLIQELRKMQFLQPIISVK